MQSDISAIKTNYGTLQERVAHLPTKTHMATTAVSIVIALTAIFIFADKIKDFVGIGRTSAPIDVQPHTPAPTKK